MKISLFLKEEFFPITQVCLLIFLLPIPLWPYSVLPCLICPPPSSHFSLPRPRCSLTSWLQPQKLVPFLFLSYLRNLFALEHKALFRPLKMATADNPISLFRGSKTKTINYQAGSDRYDQGQGLFPRDRISPLAFDFQLFPNAIHVRHSAQKELSRLYHSIKGA